MKKKCILFIVFTILTCSVKAQTGNVGIGTANPGSKLTVNGSFAAAYTSVTANTYNAGENDFSIMWDGTANGTITLPASPTSPDRTGRLYFFKNASTAYNLTIEGNGSELIDNDLNTVIQPGESVLLTKTNINTATGITYRVLSLAQSQQPYMYTINGDATQYVAQGSATQLTFSNVEYSTNGGGDFDPATSSWTCPQSGWYNLEVYAEVTSSTVYSTHTALILVKNGAIQQKLIAIFTPGYTVNYIAGSGTGSQKLNLMKGDVISISATPCYGCYSDYTLFYTRKMNISRL